MGVATTGAAGAVPVEVAVPFVDVVMGGNPSWDRAGLTPTNTLVTATENTVPKINVLEVFLALPFKARANARLGKCALVDRVPSMANLLIKPHLHLLDTYGIGAPMVDNPL